MIKPVTHSISKTTLFSLPLIGLKRIALCTLLLCLYTISYCFAVENNDHTQQKITINRIYIEGTENLVQIHCSFSDTTLINQLKNEQALLKFSIKEGDIVYRDVPITQTIWLSDREQLLKVQPPLKASIYRTEKRAFFLEFITKGKKYEIDRNAILGSVTRIFDLRPYTHYNIIETLIKSILLVAFISFTLILITPVYQKYLFKKNHIKRAGSIREESKVLLDPFTFVPIQDTDEVVVMNEKTLLLSSWKRLNKLPESQPALDHVEFFPERLEGTFFKPKTENFKKINKAWHGIIGILVGWGCFLFFKDILLKVYTSLLSPIFNSEALHLSEIIGRDTLLGFCVSIFFGVSIGLADYLQRGEKISRKQLVKRIGWRAGFIYVAFFLQALLLSYFIRSFYIISLISWLLLGIAFVFPTNNISELQKKMIIGLCIGLLSYTLYLLLNTSMVIDLIGVDISFFLSLLNLSTLSILMSDIKVKVSSKKLNIPLHSISKTVRKKKIQLQTKVTKKDLKDTGYTTDQARKKELVSNQMTNE